MTIPIVTPTTPFRTGHGAPVVGLGNNGDFYIDLDTGQEYYKSSGAWGTVLIPTGPAGATGPAGPAGQGEIGYAEKTSDTAVQSSNNSDANGVVVCSITFTADGVTPIWVLGQIPAAQNTSNGYICTPLLYDSVIGTLASHPNLGSFGGNSTIHSVGRVLAKRYIPASGSHTVSLRGRGEPSINVNDAAIKANAAGSNAYGPAWLRITKAT